MTAKERLEAAKAAREALAESKILSEEEQLEEAAAAEELALRNDEAIANAEAKYGKKKTAVVRTDSDCIIVKRPDSVLFTRFQDEMAKAEAVTSESIAKIVYPCIVYPDKSRFGAMVEEQPILLQRCLVAVADLAGARRNELGGKY